MKKNYQAAVLETKKVLLTNKTMSKTLARVSKKVHNLQAKEESVRDLNRAASTERQKRLSLEQELARQVKK